VSASTLAHPVAPTNVSALLSSVIVNLVIYGIIRVNLDLRPVEGELPGIIALAAIVRNMHVGHLNAYAAYVLLALLLALVAGAAFR